MEESPEHLRCRCPHCGGAVSFPPELAGSSADCPHCGDPLDLAEPDAREEGGAGAAPGGLTASMLALALRGRVPRERPSMRYRAALVLGAVAMLVLPLVYVGLVAAVGWAWGSFAVRWPAWSRDALGDPGMAWVRVGLHVAGVLVGGLVLVFLLKPLLARPTRRAPPLALNPAAEPLLFAFLAMVCDTVGAPRPGLVAVDCQRNAAAGYRGGWGGLVRGDLVLTLGLPLVAVLDLRQLAGVLAHELGHFRQRFGMRASAVVRAVNGWLARVVHERDAWDEMIAGWTHGGLGWRWQVLAAVAGTGIGSSRGILRVLMLAGRAVSGLLLREMERQADRCEVAVAGSAAFEATRNRLRALNDVARPYYQSLRASWDRDRTLPENLPRGLAAAEAALPDADRVRLRERESRREPHWTDSHPPMAERIGMAQAAGTAGLFSLEGPATGLFADFDVLAAQVTRLHYVDDLGLPAAGIRFAPGDPDPAR